MKTKILTLVLILFIVFSGLEAKPKQEKMNKIKPEPEFINFVIQLFKDIEKEDCQAYKPKLYKYFANFGNVADIRDVKLCTNEQSLYLTSWKLKDFKYNTYLISKSDFKAMKDDNPIYSIIEPLFNSPNLTDISEYIVVDFCSGKKECCFYSVFIKVNNDYKMICQYVAG
jgi:hypothetical protein